MTNETFETETLETLAEKIAQYATEADEQTIATAMLLRELRKQIEDDKAGEVKWYPWAEKHIKLKKTQLRVLLRIAEANDPRAELVRIRKETARRVA